ncbi:MAG TPA: type VI secretion system protein TssL [Spongiibacteraceae bacterium]|nr:type VI secretion system protein TssL [Spongiibacteraceae bacterium]HCS27130.1 type VI secretion system protein TssL [Spongiibacteraceae bacterium]
MPPDALKFPPPKSKEAGAPAWVLTFADLMSLLLAFFVLLFSFSEIDKQKFKEMAGSMKDAFGVQRELRATDTPVGNNIIAREFSPSMNPSVAINEVRQTSNKDPMSPRDLMKVDKSFSDDLNKVKQYLEVEILKGQVEVDDDGHKVIVIRIREKGSFPSGSAALAAGFEAVINKIAALAKEIDQGSIVVAGHTDDVPIYTNRYRSNWDLSSARAATVLDKIVSTSGERSSRFHVTGHADTKPIDDNATPEGRARNRRVEVLFLRGAPYVPAG